jgi:hypothetical protein
MFGHSLGHLQRADASHPCTFELVWPDRRVASGATRPARPIPGPNLRHVCINADVGRRRACPLAYAAGPYGSDPDVTWRCWWAGACSRRDTETRNDINAGTEAQALAADRCDDAWASAPALMAKPLGARGETSTINHWVHLHKEIGLNKVINGGKY